MYHFGRGMTFSPCPYLPLLISPMAGQQMLASSLGTGDPSAFTCLAEISFTKRAETDRDVATAANSAGLRHQYFLPSQSSVRVPF